METTNNKTKSRLSMEVKVEVMDTNLKSLGRSFDTYKETASDSMNDIKSSMINIHNDLKDHVKWEEAYHDRNTEKADRLYDKMQEYIDERHKESIKSIALVESRCAKSWTEKAVYGIFSFVGIMLITAIGYLYSAKQNDDNVQKDKIEIIKDD